MKHAYFIALSLFLSATTFGQIVFESNFENWTNPNQPTDWVGTRTQFSPDSIQQSTDGPTFGTYLVELTNVSGSHRRFTSQPISLMENQPYEVEVWVKGSGSIRTGLFDADVSDNDFGFSYNQYQEINSSFVLSFVQTIIPDTTYESCELILSTLGGIVEIDRVELRIGEIQPPTPLTITEIQETTDPDGDSPESGTFAITSGVVTAVSDFGYYIQDGTGPWSGLRVEDSENMVSIGDDITVTGVVQEFFFLTRLSEVSEVVVNGTATLPAPLVLGTNEINDEQYEGVLVRTTGDCIEAENEFGEWLIDDGSGQIMVDNEMYDFSPDLGQNYQVTGPLTYTFSAFKIEPRNQFDVEIVSDIQENSSFTFEVFPNPTTDFLTLTHGQNEAFMLQLLDAQGRLVMDANITGPNTQLDVRSLSAGMYTMLLFNETSVSATKLQVR